MTSRNWTAQLSGLQVTGGFGFMNLELFKLPDANEDGIITSHDFSQGGDSISVLYSGYIDESIPVFDPVDITEWLRTELFDSGATGITSGFIMIPGTSEHSIAHMSNTSPVIRISLSTPTEASPTCTPICTLPPTPSPTPTPKNTPNFQIGVNMRISDTHFETGDFFKLRAYCVGFPWDTSADLFIVLDAFGSYWFYPNWEQVPDSRAIALHGSQMQPFFILDFPWPEGDFGHADGLRFWGAMFRPGTAFIIGNYAMLEFGY